ncbi:MAG: hypothetical protein ABI406_06350 [Ktedonobacteraceae bacterium]
MNELLWEEDSTLLRSSRWARAAATCQSAQLISSIFIIDPGGSS